MLINLCVKDLALIKGVDINFGKGLNIITGETGAGKSIIIGSINIALGEKINKELIRDNADFGLVELVFNVNNKMIKDKLELLGIPIDDDQIIISRKIMKNHSISKINGMTVTLTALRQITEGLVDIHGQHDHQSLLHKAHHLEILDEYAGDMIYDLKKEFNIQFKKVKQLSQELIKYEIDEEQRLREISFYQFEIEEINQASLKLNEDIELEEQYKKVANARNILEVLAKLSSSSIEIELGSCLKELNSILVYDEKLKLFYDQLMDIEYTYQDIMRDISHYTDETIYDEQIIFELENRLNLINKLKNKYGNSIEHILNHRESSIKKLEELIDFEKTKASLNDTLSKSKILLNELAINLSKHRKLAAKDLEGKIVIALEELNFNGIQFEIGFSILESVTEKGLDSVEFLLSTNPGEPVKPLNKIASGGELSRIMLAIKTIFAGKGNIDTLIFDEIDTGISGRTAQKVSEKLNLLGENHQVICITHLAQIAAMADNHFMIEKKIFDNQTLTDINKLDYDESINELSRILGGIQITDTVKKNAIEMKEQAVNLKKMNN